MRGGNRRLLEADGLKLVRCGAGHGNPIERKFLDRYLGIPIGSSASARTGSSMHKNGLMGTRGGAWKRDLPASVRPFQPKKTPVSRESEMKSKHYVGRLLVVVGLLTAFAARVSSDSSSGESRPG